MFNTLRQNAALQFQHKIQHNSINKINNVIRSFQSSSLKLGVFDDMKNDMTIKPETEIKVEKLVRPIGLRNKPISGVIDEIVSKGLFERGKDILDSEKRLERRKELQEEFSKSGLYQSYVFRHTKGKVFIPSPYYFKSEKSLYFPNMIGKTLKSNDKKSIVDSIININNNNNNKISIIRLFTNSEGEKLSSSFFINPKLIKNDNDLQEILKSKPKLKDESISLLSSKSFEIDNPNLQIIEITLTENFIKGFFQDLFLKNIRKITPEYRHDKYFILPRSQIPLSTVKKLKIENIYTGYIFIVDFNGKIRWASCGEANFNEITSLWKTINGVLEEKKQLK